jgi:serine/threonine-protein kinase
MSPEQVRGRPVDARSDLYSLGITMWWMLAGAAPFTAETPKEVLKKHVTESIPPLSERARSPVSKSFIALVARATAKDPADRFADAQELSRALEACRAEDLAGSTTKMETDPPRRSRKTMVLIAAGAASLLALYAALPGEATSPSSEPIAIPVTPPPPVVSAPQEIAAPAEKPEPLRAKPRPKKLVRKARPKPPPPSILTTPI